MTHPMPVSHIDLLVAWLQAQQLRERGLVSPQLLVQLQALQSLLAPRYRQDPLGLPMWPPSPPPLTLQQQLQVLAQQNLPFPYSERFAAEDRRADAFAGSPLDSKSGHFPRLTELAPLWKI